jgi:hypothetical protein
VTCRPSVRHGAGLLARAAALVAALTLAGSSATAQRPDAHWQTIATPHFRVHFAPASEEVARRAAASAEWAYAALARELVAPRGTIELVVSDDVDFSNGFTTTFPTNRIVIYADPPVDEGSLRNYSDWITLVVTHELTHVFQLDRSRGAWAALQHVFGRNPFLFPAAYEPRWMTEGIAVYYESRITGSGRIVGTAHRAIARAAAIGGRSPSLASLSTSRTSYPGGESVYIYGSLVIDELAREDGAASVPAFIERSSAAFPFFYNRLARRAFGESFADLLRAVRDSTRAGIATGGGAVPLDGWHERASGFDLIRAPRWLDSTRIVFAGDRGRETSAAYVADAEGHLRRLGRRVGVEPNVPLSDGSLLTAQLEFSGPFEIRSDLYVQRGRTLRRLTFGERLAAPDARADGEIVAVQAEPGTTRLVRVSPDGRRVRPITMASLDTQWAQPRWSPGGDAIAAVRLIRGGRSQIVVIDSGGTLRQVVADEQGSVSAAPSWSADGTAIYFTSDRSGTREVYAQPLSSMREKRTPDRLSDAITALSDPEPRRGSSAQLAAVWLRATGNTLGTGTAVVRADSMASALAASRAAAEPPVMRDSSAVRPYRALRQLVPRYWLPTMYSSDNDLVLGAVTSGSDVVGRHSYVASAEASTRRNEQGGALGYAWSGLGRPVVQLSLTQGWDGAGSIVATDGTELGSLRRRTRTIEAGLSATRPKTRSYLAVSAGGGLELRDYATDPRPLLDALREDYFRTTHRRPFAVLGAAASNVQRPARSYSAEDGVTASASAERLWDADERRGGHLRALGAVAGYKSLDLPGYAHHVIAVRAAGGWTDTEDGTDLTVGGGVGGALGTTGLAVGETREFPVRGYSSGALAGTRAVAASLEYRAPVTMPSSGLGFLYFDRTSLAVFGDAASAWCRGPARSAAGCGARTRPGTPIASVGAEFIADLAFIYDRPLSIGIGVAVPVGALRDTDAAAPGLYFSAGHSF